VKVHNWQDEKRNGRKAEFDLENNDGLILRRCHLFETKGEPRIGFTQFRDGPPFEDAIGFSSQESYWRYQRQAMEAVAAYLERFGMHRPDLLAVVRVALQNLDKKR